MLAIVKKVSIISGRICTDKVKKMGWAERRTVAKKATFLLKRFFAIKKNSSRVAIPRKSAKRWPTVMVSPKILKTRALQKVNNRGCPREKRDSRLPGKRLMWPASFMWNAAGTYTPISSQ